MIRQLVFLDEAPSWLRLDGDSVVARGAGWPVADAPVIAVVPGESVVLHWVELPPLAPAQALAAARLLAVDVSAAPLDQLHVALGTVEADGRRPLALVDRAMMAEWLTRLALAGINNVALVPLPLLLPLPAEGVTLLAEDGLWTVRGAGLGFTAEAGLAEMMLGAMPRQTIDKADFVAGLGGRLAALPLDLRQGQFAEQSPSRLDGTRVRRLALLAGAALALWLANDVAGLLRNSLAADRAEVELADAARAALPRGTTLTDPRGQVAARLARLGGGGFAGVAAPLVGAVRDRPGMALQSLRYTPDAGLVAVVAVPAATDGAALAQAVAAAGLSATPGPARAMDGATLVDLTVRPR